MSLQNTLFEMLAPLVQENGLYLEKVTLKNIGKQQVVTVVVDLYDTAGSVTSEQIVDISRLISDLLDEKDPIKQVYTLEVTTAGAERKITDLRLWKRAVGRTVSFVFEGQKKQGKVQAISSDESKVTIDETEYDIDKIEKAKTIIVF